MSLDNLLKTLKEDLERRKEQLPLELLGRSLSANPYVPRDIKKCLTSSSEKPIKIVAQINKKDENFDILRVAQDISSQGVEAMFIATSPHLNGEVEHITQLRRYVHTPLIRDEIIFDKYQIVESLVFGADCVCLSASILSTSELKELYEYALYVGLEAIVEIKSLDELKKAMKCGANIICIEQIDLNICKKLISFIPNGKTIIVKGSINGIKHIKDLSALGVDAFVLNYDNLEDVLKQSN